MNDSRIQLTLVIPCFNEEANLVELVRELKDQMMITPFQVYLVDNGSTDNTQSKLKEILARLPSSTSENIKVLNLPKNLNYGGGIKAGIRECETEYVGWFHADLQIEAKEISKMILGLKPGVTLIKGLRKSRPLTERLFTGGMSLIASILFQSHLKDINGQPTVYRRSFLEQYPVSPDDFLIDAFFYINATKKKYKISRFPVLMKSRKHGESSWNKGLKSQLKFSLITIKSLWKMRVKNYA